VNVLLIPPSDKELEETIGYYNDQMPGLGEQFYDAFQSTVNYINIAPEAWRKVGCNTRRINIKRFPHLILYVLDGENILITCIAHQHRNPTYYSNRI
jgi:hypothetical protein